MSNYRNEKELAALFKALGNPNRITMLDQLASCCAPGTVWEVPQQKATVGELSQCLDLAPSTVSHHLKELVSAGFIQTQRRGKNVACWVSPDSLHGLAQYICGLLGCNIQREEPMIETPDKREIREAVRDNYAKAAQRGASSSSCCAPSCCGDSKAKPSVQDVSSVLGYSDQDLQAVPDGANLGLGCGNPQAIADLKPGETVLDLGAGGGFDCFLAARQVGGKGKVIGVDMTPEMIAKARENAEKAEFTNVEFRLGEIEHLPVADDSVDVIISNCVINLAPDKGPVYREAFRVLKAGGRLAISDVVALKPLPEDLIKDMAMWAGCAAGALTVAELEETLSQAGFSEYSIEVEEASARFIKEWAPGTGLENYVASAKIQAAIG